MLLDAADRERLEAIALEAGQHILPYFRKPHGARHKQDRSPVTDADMAAHDAILAALAHAFPGIPIISEEDAAPVALDISYPFFLVDPLDGTRSFVRGEDEFTVNIGLVEAQKPVFGVIHAPVRQLLYSGGHGLPPQRRENGGDAVPIHVRHAPPNGLIVTRSRSHPSRVARAYLETLPPHMLRPASSAIKFGWVAEGSADLYPRFGRTMEWDTAAGQAILEAAGGRMTTIEDAPLLYGKEGFENPGFIAYGADAAQG